MVETKQIFQFNKTLQLKIANVSSKIKHKNIIMYIIIIINKPCPHTAKQVAMDTTAANCETDFKQQ